MERDASSSVACPEALIALDLAMTLEDEGFSICGPHDSVDVALNAISTHPPDAAILDVNLGQGQSSAPVADRLVQNGVPFVFLTGYEQIEEKLEARFRSHPKLGKPFDRGKVITVVNEMLNN